MQKEPTPDKLPPRFFEWFEDTPDGLGFMCRGQFFEYLEDGSWVDPLTKIEYPADYSDNLSENPLDYYDPVEEEYGLQEDDDDFYSNNKAYQDQERFVSMLTRQRGDRDFGEEDEASQGEDFGSESEENSGENESPKEERKESRNQKEKEPSDGKNESIRKEKQTWQLNAKEAFLKEIKSIRLKENEAIQIECQNYPMSVKKAEDLRKYFGKDTRNMMVRELKIRRAVDLMIRTKEEAESLAVFVEEVRLLKNG